MYHGRKRQSDDGRAIRPHDGIGSKLESISLSKCVCFIWTVVSYPIEERNVRSFASANTLNLRRRMGAWSSTTPLNHRFNSEFIASTPVAPTLNILLGLGDRLRRMRSLFRSHSILPGSVILCKCNLTELFDRVFCPAICGVRANDCRNILAEFPAVFATCRSIYSGKSALR